MKKMVDYLEMVSDAVQQGVEVEMAIDQIEEEYDIRFTQEQLDAIIEILLDMGI